jgi:hypothetical protein
MSCLACSGLSELELENELGIGQCWFDKESGAGFGYVMSIGLCHGDARDQPDLDRSDGSEGRGCEDE